MIPTARIAVKFTLIVTLGLQAGPSPAEEPRFDDSFSITEGAPRGETLGVVTSPEPAPEESAWGAYEIVGGNDADAFAIDEQTGELRLEHASAIDFERQPQYELTVRMRMPLGGDGARRSFAADLLASGVDAGTIADLLTRTAVRRVKVAVVNANERPTLPSQTLTLIADEAGAFEHGSLQVIDEDRGDGHRFTIVGGGGEGLIVLDETTGEVSVSEGREIDPGKRIVPLTVRVTDRAGLSDATTVYVRIIRLAPPPAVPVPSEIEPAPAIASDDAPSTTQDEPPTAVADVPQPAADTIEAVDQESSTAVAPTVTEDVVTSSAPARTPKPGKPVKQSQDHAVTPDAAVPVASAETGAGWLRLLPVVLVLAAGIGAFVYLRMRRRGSRQDWSTLPGGAARSHGATPGQESTEEVAEAPPEARRPTAPLVFPTREQLAASIEPVTEAASEAPAEAGAAPADVEAVPSPNALAEEEQVDRPPMLDALPAMEIQHFDEDTPVTTSDAVDSSVPEETDPMPDAVASEAFELETTEFSDVVEDIDADEIVESASDAVETAALQEANAAFDESESPMGIDPRVDSLRQELSDLFGVSVDEMATRSQQAQASEAATVPDADAEPTGETESIGEDNTPSVGEVPSAIPADTIGERITNLLGGSTGGGSAGGGSADVEATGLESARFLSAFGGASNDDVPTPADTAAVDEQPSTAEAGQPVGPEAYVVAPSMPTSATARVNKTAVRREISFLRDVANRHARGVLAREETKVKIRYRLFLSGMATGILCFAGMSLLMSAVSGAEQAIGWGMLSAGAIAFALCLQAFQKLANSDRQASQEDHPPGETALAVDPPKVSATPGAERPESVTGSPAPTSADVEHVKLASEPVADESVPVSSAID